MKNLLENRIIIISGPYGTGKTNIAVNLAEYVVKTGKKACIVDFDIVNPYFRSADNIEELKKIGVRPIIPEFANTNVELPIFPKEYYSIFSTDEYSIVDVGGDAYGAVALAVDHDKYEDCSYSMYYVYNFYRPMTSTPKAANLMLKQIENTSHLRFSGIINNSNLGTETTVEDVKNSVPYAKEFAELSGLPLMLTTALGSLRVEGAYPIENKTKKYF